jgi:hypothetical protein
MRMDITLLITKESGGGLQGEFHYHTGYLAPATAARMAKHMQVILGWISLVNKDVPLLSKQLLCQEEIEAYHKQGHVYSLYH